MSKILVFGGAGYSGSVLVQELLEKNHNVTVFDMFWFGDWFGPEANGLKRIHGDIRNPELYPQESFDSVIHLANIANDPGVELNPLLSWEVNVLASHHIADWAVRHGVPQVIFASSGSVYGVKEEEKVTEDLTLVPLSYYNKTKMVAERVFLSYADRMKVHIIRPATICGVSPRMRFDLTVNMLTKQAVHNGEITVFGGPQVRPNIHIEDISGVYTHFIDNPGLESGLYNAGFENLSVMEIARHVAERTEAKISVSDSNDPRSYRLDSSKLLSVGFKPRKTVADAINEVESYCEDRDQSSRVEWMTVAMMNKLQLDKESSWA